jgi:predicted kinase
MEFLHYRHQTAANVLLNRYLTMTSDENALAALPLFMSMRAAIRAKVLYDRFAQNCSDKAAVARTAHAYFELAHRLIHPPAPRLVAIGGLSGTGKSVLARALAPAIEPLPGAVVLRSDIARKQQFQASETRRLPSSAYQPEVTVQIYRILAQRAGQILAQGHSVVVDAVFACESERNAIRDVARGLHIPFIGLFLTADVAIRMQRVGQRKGDASDATPEIAELQEGYDTGAVDWASVDASGTMEQALQGAEAALINCKRQSP